MKYKDQIDKVKNYTGGKETGAANAMGDFAELLGMLSEDADKNSEAAIKVGNDNLEVQKDVKRLTDKLVIYTRWIIALTVALLILGFAQFYSSIQISRIADKTTLKTNQSDENPKTKTDANETKQGGDDGAKP